MYSPYGPIPMDPASAALHYALEVRPLAPV